MDKELDNKQQNYILVYEVESYRNWFLRDPEPTMDFPTLKYVKYVLFKLKFVAKMLPKNILQIFPSPIEFMTVSFSWSSFGVNSVWLLSLRTPSGMVTITWPQLFKKKFIFFSLFYNNNLMAVPSSHRTKTFFSLNKYCWKKSHKKVCF